ncbi:MAG: Glu-tRNA(Gln) amidotransferase subunit GatD [Methanomicrobiales archaeon]|nr:Glu-tRNA(Gln) amidotransferase subunit GatD [Methanomicrobiales archaeon]
MSKKPETGDIIRCTLEGCSLEGAYIASRDGMATIKLTSGYNIGVPEDTLETIATSELAEPQVVEITQDVNLPLISIVSTGGTIASKIDYRTGAVTSQFKTSDILNAIPGLVTLARFRAVQLCNILSENMTPSIWQQLARAIHDEIKAGARGIVVTHGTDTMAYSAAAVSFMLKTPVPVVFVGSQRSADRPSSDNVMNGMCAAKTALSELGEVVVVMHGSTSDDACAIHRGTRVRKMHTSRRDAFQTIGSDFLGTVSYPSLTVKLSPSVVKRDTSELILKDHLEEKCGIVWYYPGMSVEILSAWKGYKGIVLAGTGLGHAGTDIISRIKEMNDSGTLFVMTSQCLKGRVCDRVYDTGRDLLNAGVIEGEDMLPEVTLVKLMWVLGNSKSPQEARELMKENLAGEMTRRSSV